jgi:hypothetical protein
MRWRVGRKCRGLGAAVEVPDDGVEMSSSVCRLAFRLTVIFTRLS